MFLFLNLCVFLGLSQSKKKKKRQGTFSLPLYVFLFVPVKTTRYLCVCFDQVSFKSFVQDKQVCCQGVCDVSLSGKKRLNGLAKHIGMRRIALFSCVNGTVPTCFVRFLNCTADKRSVENPVYKQVCGLHRQNEIHDRVCVLMKLISCLVCLFPNCITWV